MDKAERYMEQRRLVDELWSIERELELGSRDRMLARQLRRRAEDELIKLSDAL